MSPVIGRAVKKSREETGLSTAILAQQIGVAESQLKEFEAGQLDLPASVLMRLARAIGLPATSFLTSANAEATKPVLDRAKFSHTADAPVLSEADVIVLAREVTRSRVFSDLVRPSVSLDDYKPTKPGPLPWSNGYDLATLLRADLDRVADPIPNMQTLLETQLGILVVKHAFSDPRLRAVAVRARQGRLVAVSNRLPIPILRMSLAHELCHHLCDLGPDDILSESDDVNSGSFSNATPAEEQRAKAFAVMFLAPSALVRELLGPPNHQFETVAKALMAAQRLATRCGISTTASLWHLFHLNYLTNQEYDVQVWLRQVDRDPPLIAFERDTVGNDGLQQAIEQAFIADDIEADQADWLRSL